jgi:ribonuclease-3
MNELARLATAREPLRARIAALVGTDPIERFEEALTHASFANETGAPDNQRLEFLGDAVLGLCVSELLTERFASADEGQLTRMRSALVNADALAAWAEGVGLGACIALGRGASLGTERQQTNVLADATEALVAAVYEARGLDGARAFVRDVVAERIARVEELATPDPKSALQERIQAEGGAAPTYRLVQVRGAGHRQVFEVEVLFDGRGIARGEGHSKRLAERAAATAALELLPRESTTDAARQDSLPSSGQD